MKCELHGAASLIWALRDRTDALRACAQAYTHCTERPQCSSQPSWTLACQARSSGAVSVR